MALKNEDFIEGKKYRVKEVMGHGWSEEYGVRVGAIMEYSHKDNSSVVFFRPGDDNHEQGRVWLSSEMFELVEEDPIMKGGEQNMQNNFKVGDFIVLIDPEEAHRCDSTNDNRDAFVKLEIVSLSTDGERVVKAAWINEKGEIFGHTCCSLYLNHYKKVSANDIMTKELKVLTEEQKDGGISPENQALVKLGIVNDKLELIDTDYVIRQYYKANKALIAKAAQADVAKIEAELKKASSK